MAYNVTFGGLSFKAAFFDIPHVHPGDTWGMPGTGDTIITMRLWVRSNDVANMEPATRTALFEHANWFRGDSRNDPQVLTLEVNLNNQEGSHKYTFDHAWLRSYIEYQETTYGADKVDIPLPRIDPNVAAHATGLVSKGEVQKAMQLELLFVGFIEADEGSKID